MKTAVYLGPSLNTREASKILAAEYLPPVRRGDLTNLSPQVEVVGIVDGVLLTDAAVGHREIMTLLDQGIKVFGGGSMGALRAAELSDMGMIGVGRIYEEYSSGRIDGDDEVVLAYDPFEHTPLSEPLINLRLNLQRAMEDGIIDLPSYSILIKELKAVFFPHRSYELLYSTAKGRLGNERSSALEEYLRRSAMDFKREDAILLLKAVKAYIEKEKKIKPR